MTNTSFRLRHLLTNGGFKLPGEAQKIDRIISAFSECYWEDNAGDRHHCPFQDQGTVYILSFAVIMLNTDLHKSKSPNGSCIQPPPVKKMSKPEFISNLRGALKDEDMKTKYFLKIYDAIASRPIVMREVDRDIVSSRYYDVRAGLQALLKNEKSADALLRGLAIHEYRFSKLEDYAHQLYDGASKNAARELTRNLLMKVWHFFHSLINTSLDVAYLDRKGMDLSIDLLKYMLSLTVCLELPTERKAFLSQLGRMRRLNKMKSSSTIGQFGQFQNMRTDEIYHNVENGNISSDKGKLQSLGQINQLMQSLSFDDTGTEETKAMKLAVGQLKSAAFLLADPSRTFIRHDDLIKQANTTGRRVEYRFFLFSDMLIYAKQISKSAFFKVHEELPLVQMKVIDWFPPDAKGGQRRFDIFHPRKKVVVLCTNRDEKRVWVDAIRSAIDKEVKRKVTIEQARAATMNAD